MKKASNTRRIIEDAMDARAATVFMSAINGYSHINIIAADFISLWLSL